MSDVTVAQFAEVLKVPVDRLLVQLESAGIQVAGPQALISDEAKLELLTHLRRAHGAAEPSKTARRRRAAQDHAGAQVAERAQAGEHAGPRAHGERRSSPQEDLHQARRSRRAEQAARRARPTRSARNRKRRKPAERERLEAARKESERMEAENRRRIEDEATKKKQAEEARRAAGRSARQAGNRSAAPCRRRSRRPAPAARARAPQAGEGAGGRASIRPRTPRYGRQELHVAGGVGARNKKKKRVKERTGTGSVSVESRHAFEMPTAPIKREVTIGETITPQEIAQKMAVKATEVIKTMLNMGVMATINQPIDRDTATLVVEEMGHIAKVLEGRPGRRGSAGRRSARDRIAASARGHRHGPRRPRQDLAARLHPHARKWPRAKRAASRSTSARTTWKRRRAWSRSSIRPATRRSPPCVRAARRRPTSWCSWSRPTTASCRRPSKQSSTPRLPAFRSSSR